MTTTNRKTTVTHPDGTVSTRTSKTRTYTHAVVVTPAPAAKAAASLRRRSQALADKAAALYAAADAGQVTIQSRGFSTSDPYNSHQATLNGTSRQVYTWSSADGLTEDYSGLTGKPSGTSPAVVNATEYLIRSARSSASRYQDEAADLASQANRVEAIGEPVGDYGVLRWSSRYDLAAKALSEFDVYTTWGHAVEVVSVDA